MPTEIERRFDKFLDGLSNKYSVVNDILIVTEGTKKINDHWAKIRNVLERLNSLNIHLKLKKCVFAEREAKWLGFYLLQTGIKPLNNKVQGFTDPLKPKILKKTAVVLRRGEPIEPIQSKSRPTLLTPQATAENGE